MVDQPPTRDSIMQEFHRSFPGQWEHFDSAPSLVAPADALARSVRVYNEDVNLRLESAGVAVEDFYQEWVDSYPDREATSYSYWLFYGRSPIERKVLVAVDGYRAHIPIPRERDGELTIQSEEAQWGKIITQDSEAFQTALEYPDIKVI